MPATALEFRTCTLHELRAQGVALFAAHYAEVSLDQDVPLDIDWERFAAHDQLGSLLIVGVYDGDEMVGYSLNVVARHPHYALLVSHNDAVYLDPGHRRARNGRRLIDATVELAKREFVVDRVSFHVKPGSALHRMLDHDDEWSVRDIIYVKRV